MAKIRCSVNTCEFWGEGEVCQADSIWVKNNMSGVTDDELYLTEFADEPGNKYGMDKSTAETSSQTCCETMRPQQKRQEKDKRGPARGR